MVNITDKKNCCGCSACAQKCPKRCISMREDPEGFLYPEIDKDRCIGCGLCESVCPELNQGVPKKPSLVYAAKAKDDRIREASSSGGVFSLLAETVLEEGGVIFGSAFNDRWEAEHIFVEDKESLPGLRGSKYMQSVVGQTFSQAKDFLDKGWQVLFSGTPCQIAGLKNYLGKDYDNLLAVDVICHGATSPKVWRLYLDELARKKCGCVSDVSFRDKTSGWKQYSISICGEKGIEHREHFADNVFFRLFLENVILRPSCYDCPAKSGKSGSDITLGDFWGIDKLMPEFDDDKGCSVVSVNTDAGRRALDKLEMVALEVPAEEAFKHNPSFHSSVRPHVNRNWFFYVLKKSGCFSEAYDSLYSSGLLARIRRKLYRITGERR
ncbi:MAG: Coenzyme F420 hydrogenase/dehydrogenase, beta subunit C-terminal domain [Candidatus Cryptobacteroides sp.]